MNARKRTLNTEESESDFRQLLREVRANRLPTDALLEHAVFKNRLRLITMANARTAQDAEELANDVRLRVWKNLQQFKPDDKRAYDGFFSWVRGITRHAFFNSLRANLRRPELDDRPIEDIDIADPKTDIEFSVLYKEVLTEFEKSIHALPRTQRLAIAFYLQGHTFKEISEKMHEAGFRSSHATVRTWIKGGIKAFSPNATHLQENRSENVRVTKIRATRAKRQFHTILEKAIDSGAAAITSEDTYSLTLVRVRPKRSKTKQPNSRPGWQSANDLLKSMQSRESKEGVQAAFESSPEDLGRAAVEYATKERNVPVSSLTTFLMATSTANVVGRVMNLTKDAP
ncbi:MAG TPA: sigma-70 family RNA polymerase sigma factor [Pyrinomonadaceae bacterium]|nr:sigma-70 family RNA polymerase sigma factor [Pyrinomonadaceae bacterium]